MDEFDLPTNLFEVLFLDILFPLFFIIYFPTIILFYYEEKNEFIDLYYISVNTLLISLLIFHLYFWLRRNRASRNVPKYIDYIYLSVATLGLLSAADISVREYSEEINKFAKETQKHALSIISNHKALYQAKCQDKELEQNKQICDEAAEKIQISGSIMQNIDSEYEYSVIIENIHNIEKYYNKSQTLFNPGDSIILFDEKLSNNQDRLAHAPFGYLSLMQTGYLLIDLKRFGYLLIAAALGLRITKVTIERFEWHTKR